MRAFEIDASIRKAFPTYVCGVALPHRSGSVFQRIGRLLLKSVCFVSIRTYKFDAALLVDLLELRLLCKSMEMALQSP